MDSVMKGLMGQFPQNFWARTAPDKKTCRSFHAGHFVPFWFTKGVFTVLFV